MYNFFLIVIFLDTLLSYLSGQKYFIYILFKFEGSPSLILGISKYVTCVFLSYYPLPETQAITSQEFQMKLKILIIYIIIFDL